MSKFRSIYPALFSCSLFFILLSCSTDTDTVSVSIKTAPVASYAVSSDTITVSSEDISGKTLYLAVINPSDQIISADDVPYAVSSSGLAGKSALIRSPVSVHSGICPVSDSAAVQPETDDVWNAVRISRVQASSRSAESSAGSETVLDTGTQKSFYLKSGSVKTATLRAAGTYCYVWIADEYYTGGACRGSYVNTALAVTIASCFDKAYTAVHAVFGNESDMLVGSYNETSQTYSTVPMTELSDTGTRVNIMLFDIGSDGSNGSVYASFSSSDYFSRSLAAAGNYYGRSNQGKYIYLDSYYAASLPGTALSSTVHEFQHMICFSTKVLVSGLSLSTGYKEMLSMLCEDMMQRDLNIPDSASPKMRLGEFCSAYPYSGTCEYRGFYPSVSYAAVYAFGAWAARNFGGASFISAMAHNSLDGMDSVVSAVNTVNGTAYTAADILSMYAESFLREDGAGSMREAGETFTCGSYTYPMKGIDLWDAAYSWKPDLIDALSVTNSSDSSGRRFGPCILSGSYRYDSRPYSVSIYRIGTAAGNPVTLRFSQFPEQLKLYVLAQ